MFTFEAINERASILKVEKYGNRFIIKN